MVESYGFISLLPAIFVVAYVLYTKKIFEGLIIGSLIEFIIVYKTGFFSQWLSALVEVMKDGDTVWIILTVGLFSALIKLLEKSRGSMGFAGMVSKYAKSEKSSLLITWVMGIAIFVDDYLNVFTIGGTMRPVVDKNRTPREMLAYIADSTAAPTCVLIPFSTWVAYFSMLFAKQEEIAHLGSAMEMYMKAIPYMFYAWAALFIVPLVILGIIPKLGPMKTAYDRVQKTGQIHSDKSSLKGHDDTVHGIGEDLEEGKLINFVLPLATLIGITIYTDDLLLGTFAGVFVAGLMYFAMRLIKFHEIADTVVEGFAEMIPVIFMIVAAWTFQAGANELGLSNYIIESVEPIINGAFLPVIAFIVLCILTFTTGSNWGVTTLSIPIFIPLCVAVGANPFLTMGAIISGAVFGSHACFYTDTTILTSTACKVDNMDHALTQIPYVAIASGISIVLYTVCGFIL